MRAISPEFAAHLGAQVTTICRCWKITRRDNVVIGFTEHDRLLQFGGTDYFPSTGLDSTVTGSSSGLAADSLEVIGALSSNELSSDDIRANKYDGAQVQVWIVNWSNPGENLLENTYRVGEISEQDGIFKAELRTLETELDQTRGEHFIRQCQANLGDERCGVVLATPAYQGAGTVTSTNGERQITASGLSQFASNWFENGVLHFTSGNNSGVSIEVTRFQPNTITSQIELWQQMPALIEIGDTFDIVAGCDKTFSTCKEKFANALEFRGFPHLPGGDFALSYASNSRNFDGGIIIK